MKFHLAVILLLISTVEHSAGNRFFISAPNVFHLGVKETVLVQLENPNPVTLYLEHETTGGLVSERKTVQCGGNGDIKTVELMIDTAVWSTLSFRHYRPYLLVVADSPAFTVRKTTRVLVSNHRGYIFIQTDQPMYNPTKKVKYRIFTLDHTMRPHQERFHISIFNAAGYRIMNSIKTAEGGIYRDSLSIPSNVKMGTWKITAHYEGDEANAVSREFKVEKFVLPSFDVNIEMEPRYILLNTEELHFTISAMYTHGEKVKGAYHCRFGVIDKDKIHGQKMKPDFIKGLELTGSVPDGIAQVSLKSEEINLKLLEKWNKTLSDLQDSGSQLYLGVFVTNIQSGEIQEAEVYLPIFAHNSTIDLSRTRSHFHPGYPQDVVVVIRLPDGSPAAGVPVTIDAQGSSWQDTTDQEGAVFHTFNTDDAAQITVGVSANGLQERKIIRRASPPSNSFLYMTFTNKMYSVDSLLSVTYNIINGPSAGYLYYMVLSRGRIIKKGSLEFKSTSVKANLRITIDMVPSFRLIGYYHNQGGDIVADSAWIDVTDECEIKVKVKQKASFKPGQKAELQFDLHGQSARVALLAVDKAFYALNADNKLTAKQVFTAMNSYDLGCSYVGASDSPSVLSDAGLAFASTSTSKWRNDFACNSLSARQRRSVDLQQEMMNLKSNFTDTNLQDCCVQGFSPIPMRRTCQERVTRVRLVKKNQACANAFLRCCLEAERLRQRKMLEDAQRGLGRTISTADIEVLILNSDKHNIRRFFPPSFEFKDFDVNRQLSYSLFVPDSITTWEIQVVTLSAATGFCVVKPIEAKAFKKTFVSLRLPHSVKKYEQLSISPVIYNYDDERLHLAVHMEQTEGLCSPGSATSTSFVNITMEPESSQYVFFSAVPMVTGSIPIKIRLYDIVNSYGIDAVEKTLNVKTEGIEQREEETKVLKLDGKSRTIFIDGTLPDEIVPDSISNLFVSAEGDGFSNSHVKNLLSPDKVANLIALPDGCLEQTMKNLVPTALALRYLDLSEQWFVLRSGSRDDALRKIEHGYTRIFTVHTKKSDGSYGLWYSVPSSNWVTALLVKVLSLVAERQTAAVGEQGQRASVVSLDEIRQPVNYLVSIQKTDGSFTDPNPVLHNGILKGIDQDASMTAFITVALYRSLQFLHSEGRLNVEASMSRSTAYLLSHLEELQHPYAVAITAYCLSVCLPQGASRSAGWTKLQTMAIKAETDCYLWSTDASPQNQKRADAITVETTAYALLTAVGLGHIMWADRIACWLTSQENYFGGYRSSQDTIMALEALSEYELKRPINPETNLIAEFTVPGRKDIVTLTLENKKEKVETNLKKFIGKKIAVQLTGIGNAKLKIVKAYHLLEPKDDCDQLSVSVTVEGKVKYTATVMENYDYYNYDNDEEKLEQVAQSATNDAQPRNRRDVDNNQNSNEVVTYTVCVSHSQNSSLTGMAIADITLLSGFEAVTEQLDILKQLPEQYITNYEVSYGRVVIYFNELFKRQECISFDAVQRVPVGLLQPAPAVFYDYYEPDRKCTVFYSAPRRSKLVSKLCSGNVCQCAERPCQKLKETFKGEKNKKITAGDREQHACFFPLVDYAYIVEVLNVSVKSNFELYSAKVMDVLRTNGDLLVNENSVRVFAKRLQCKGQLDKGKEYLIMGKDGSTTDSHGAMQYLLESNTWVERKPSVDECKKSANRAPCKGFQTFVNDYKTDGCRQ